MVLKCSTALPANRKDNDRSVFDCDAHGVTLASEVSRTIGLSIEYQHSFAQSLARGAGVVCQLPE